jgi:ribosomal protein S17E
LALPTMFMLTACGHSHDYGVTGTCSCGESVATTITSENVDGDITFKNIVDDKIYFNFTSCGVGNICVETSTQQGVIADNTAPQLIKSVDVYKAGEKVCTLTPYFYKDKDTSDGDDSSWYWDSVKSWDNDRSKLVRLENPFYTEQNTQYNVVVTLDKHYDEFTMRVGVTVHTYADGSLFCSSCDVLNINSEEVKNATEMIYDETTQKFTYTGDFEANKEYVLKLTNTSDSVLNNFVKNANEYGVYYANGELCETDIQPGETVYVFVQYTTAQNDTITYNHAE